MNPINKFTVQPAESKDFPISYISQPSLSQEKLLGKFFVIAKIKNIAENESNILNSIIRIIENHYYNFHAPDSAPLDLNFEHIFENALQNTNLEIYQRFETIQWDELLKRLVIVAGAVKNNEICFTYFGDSQAFLFRNNKIIEIISPEQERDGEVGASSVGSARIFSYLTNGQLEGGDTVIFTTNDVLNYLPTEKLKKIFSSQYSSAELHQNMTDLFNQFLKLSSSMVVIEGSSAAEKKALEKQMIKAVLSPQLNGTKKNKRLSANFKKIIVTPLAAAINKLKAINWAADKNKMQRLLTSLKKNKPAVPKDTSAPPAASSGPEQLPKKTDKLFMGSIEKFNKLSYFSKVSLVASLALAIIFTQLTFFIIQKQKTAKEKEIYNQMTGSVEKLHNEGMAALIYENENKAKELLTEAENIIRQLPRESKEQKEKADLLTQENPFQLNKIRRIISLNEPAVFADLMSENSEPSRGILILGKYLYAFGQNFVRPIGLADKAAAEPQTSETGSFKNASVLDQNSLLFRQEDGKLTKFDLKTKVFSEIKIGSHRAAENIKDMVVYGQRLYYLSPADNQIFLYLKTTPGQDFDNETAWIKDAKADIKDGVSFTIDGNIYVLKSTGEILKFYRGVLQNFAIDKIEPPLSGPAMPTLPTGQAGGGQAKILTAFEMKNIYLLEPAGKRVIVLDKNGKLKQQYYSEKFNDLKDLTVNEAEGKIYLLNGNQIFEISLTN